MVKCKGLNLKRSDIASQLGYKEARDIVLGRNMSQTVAFEGIRRHGFFEVDTRHLIKQYRASFTKRRVLPPVMNTDGSIRYISTEPWSDETDHVYQEAVAKLKSGQPEKNTQKRKLVNDEVNDQIGMLEKKHKTGKYCVYLLKSLSADFAYIGSTNDIHRRLRQHNGVITGGAGAPVEFRPYMLEATIGEFESQNEALAYEQMAIKSRPIHINAFVEQGSPDVERKRAQLLNHYDSGTHVYLQYSE
jgi:predicted GIY-YIG superfamily endonuclease